MSPVRYSIDLVDPEIIDSEIRRRIMSKVANVVRKHVRREAPKRTGRLRKNTQRKVWSKGTKAAVYSTPPYAHLVTGGTDRHFIPARKGHVLAIGGHVIGGKGVWHHGARANDYLTRGAENSRSEVEATIKDSV